MSLLPEGCSLCVDEPLELIATYGEHCPVCGSQLAPDPLEVEERPRAVVRASSDWPAPSGGDP